MRNVACAVVALVILVGGASARAEDISACGHPMPRGSDGTLVADLSCGQGGLLLYAGADLDLNGHSIEGIVSCDTSCTIHGPGTINGDIWNLGGGKVTIVDVVVDGGGIEMPQYYYRGKLVLTNVTIRNFGPSSIVTKTAIVADKLIVDNVTVEDGGDPALPAIFVNNKIRGSNLTVRNTSTDAISAGKGLRIAGLVITGNSGEAYDNWDARVIIDGGNISNNGSVGLPSTSVLVGRKLKVESLTMTGNFYPYGLVAQKTAKVTSSTILGHGVADIYAGKRLRSYDTTCGTSEGPDGTWGVCADD